MTRPRQPTSVNEIAQSVLAHVKIRGRGPLSRFARKMVRRHNQNWRNNGARPLGRGYDWARTLMPEVLLKRGGTAAEPKIEIKAAELATEIGCCPRIARRELVRLEQQGCLRRVPSPRGAGRGLVLALHPVALAARVAARLNRFDPHPQRGPQLALPLREQPKPDAELAAVLERLRRRIEERTGQHVPTLDEARAASANRSEPSGAGTQMSGGEEKAKETLKPPAFFLHRKVDPSPPHTSPQPSGSTSSALPAGSDGRSASRLRSVIGSGRGESMAKPDEEALRNDWHELQALDRQQKEPFAEPIRRRVQRHLRLCCWFRGCDPAASRRICAAVGWKAASIGKASKRRLWFYDAIRWVLKTDAKRLAYCSSSWPRMQLAIRSGLGAAPLTGTRSSAKLPFDS